MNRRPFVIGAMVLAALASCSQGGGGSGAPEPGDADYVPDGWETPALSFDAEDYYPAAVVDFKQAPGVHARSSTFKLDGNSSKLLGPPSGGGTYAPDNGSLVSLGMAGGYVVLEFDPPLENYADAADFVVYGNAYFKGGNAEQVWQEAGTVWVMADANGNGSPDDSWYLLAPAYKNDATAAWSPLIDGASATESVAYDKAAVTADNGSSWWPAEADAEDTLSFPGVLVLPDSIYVASGATPMLRALADAAPTLVQGDLDGDNSVDGEADYPGIDPVYFYTRPDAPGDRSIDPRSGGGAAMDLAWAVDPAASFAPVALSSAAWVKIVSGTRLLNGSTGDFSCEVDAVVRALAP